MLLHENPYRYEFVPFLGTRIRHFEIEAVHWSTVGKFDTPDSVLMDWARKHDHIVFTHDLNFGTALALTKSEKPSVMQVRTQNVTISHLSKMVIHTLKDHVDLLKKGALIIVDENKKRIRILPL